MPADAHSDVIREPENYEEMKAKLEKRDEELLKKALQKRKAKTVEELQSFAAKELLTKQDRRPEHETLKDTSILREPRDKNVLLAKTELDKEISALRAKIHALPQAKTLLKERKITVGGLPQPMDNLPSNEEL